MKPLKLACTTEAKRFFTTGRVSVSAWETDFTDVAVVVLTGSELEIIDMVLETKFGIPIFVFLSEFEKDKHYTKHDTVHVLSADNSDIFEDSLKIDIAARDYAEYILPPFFRQLVDYVEDENIPFSCPGHQNGEFFRKHPAGKAFYDFYGKEIFKSDLCNADVALGDLLIHEGWAAEAEKYAAKVYNADKTYFVMNGTSTANAVAVNAILAEEDLILFDRNNHKSVYNSALILSGGHAVYLETGRNPYGFIGGIDNHCFDEKYLREQAAKVNPYKAKQKRPFRLAVIQLGTYDGTIYNARQVLDRIGHLCDYILFDSAWVGYEQFIPMMRDCSPLLLELGQEDPGIIVTQSVHKQQAGFSQSSQIHKKDNHLKGQKRYVSHNRFNNAYRLHASTSPFYPIFASLAVNAKIQEGEAGRKLWADCVERGVDARKEIFRRCKYIKPFVPPIVRDKPWHEYDTKEISNSIEFFKFLPGEKWHSFDEYGEDQYFLDPNKLLLTTPGIDIDKGEYEDFGVPAAILASYLREIHVIPEKSDLNSIVFLLTPGTSEDRLETLIDQLERFEEKLDSDAPMREILPSLYRRYEDRYKDYTIKQLCQEMHDFYKEHDAKTYQKNMFREKYFAERVMEPFKANKEFVKNNLSFVKLEDIEGRVALEGALPYPPGIFCVVPGEVWDKNAQEYFLLLEEGINRFPGFEPEIQGVYLKKDGDKQKAYGYVWNY